MTLRTSQIASEGSHRHKHWIRPAGVDAQECLRRRVSGRRLLPGWRLGQRLIRTSSCLVLVVPLRDCVVHKGVHLCRYIDVLPIARRHLRRILLASAAETARPQLLCDACRCISIIYTRCMPVRRTRNNTCMAGSAMRVAPCPH